MSHHHLAYHFIVDEEKDIIAQCEQKEVIPAPQPFVVLRITPLLEEHEKVFARFSSPQYPARIVYGKRTSGLWILLPFRDEKQKTEFLEKINPANRSEIIAEPHPNWWTMSEPLEPLTTKFP
jgi:hypothetical protein